MSRVVRLDLKKKNTAYNEHTFREDINSVLMTAMQSLLEKYDIDPTKIGRLEVRGMKAVEEGGQKDTEREGR